MNMLIYLLQVSACTGIFFLFYKAVLSRYTFFTLNRWYLLATLLVSFVIPTITIPASSPQPLEAIYHPVVNHTVSLLPVVATRALAAGPLKEMATPFNWISMVPWIYLAIAAFFAFRLAISLVRLVIRLRKNRVGTIGDVKIIRDRGNFKNGSFMNYIFLNEEELTKEELQQVLGHELAHIKLIHSADRILARMLQVVLWFNPFSYFYNRAITENHEFEVDQLVTSVSDKNAYAQLLLRLCVSPENSLYHHFSMIPLKKRIVMLFNKPTKKMKKIMYLMALPLMLLSCLAFANRETINAIKHLNRKLTREYKAQALISDLPETGTKGIIVSELKQHQDTMATRRQPDSLLIANEIFNKPEPSLFGSGLFMSKGISGTAGFLVATPSTYLIGPGDVLEVSISGDRMKTGNPCTVIADGTINAPAMVGVVKVGGLTLEQARSAIKSAAAALYPSINTSGGSVNVTIGEYRTINVIVIGEVQKPGTYSLSALSDVANALYASGGPSVNGSLRQIEVIRGGKWITSMDTYDFLMTGAFKGNIQLQNRDVIRIPVYQKLAQVAGNVNRPGVYELKDGEKLSDLIRFAGDLRDGSNSSGTVAVDDQYHKVADIPFSRFASHIPANGNKYLVK